MNDGNSYGENSQAKLIFDESKIYQFRIVGHLGSQWKDWFGEVELSLEESGYTLLTIIVIDQAALHGLLKKIRNAGMTLDSVVSVTQTRSNITLDKEI